MRVFISESLRSRTRRRLKKVPPLKENPAFDIGEGDGPSNLDDRYHDDIGEQLGRPQPENHAMSAEKPAEGEEKKPDEEEPVSDDLIHLDTDAPVDPDDTDGDENFKSDLDDDDATEEQDEKGAELSTDDSGEPEADDNKDPENETATDTDDEQTDAETPDKEKSGEVADNENVKGTKESTEPPAPEKENADDKRSSNSPVSDPPDSSGGSGDNSVEAKPKPESEGGKHDSGAAGATKSKNTEPAFFKMTPSETNRQALFSLLGSIGVNNTRNLLYRVEKDGVHVRTAGTAGTITGEAISAKFDSVETFITLLRRNGGIPF